MALISDVLDFKIKKVKKDTERHFILIKGIMHQEDITRIKFYTPNQGTTKNIKQVLRELKEETDQNTLIVGDLNTQLLEMDRSSKQKSIRK